jgi:DNA-binding transcriptional ArsR family regulator
MSQSMLDERQLGRLFGALSDPTRREIVSRLAETDLAVLDLVSHFPISQPAISKHLRVLEDAGLVSREQAGRQRLCHLEGTRLQPVADWVTPYHRFWSASFTRLDVYLDRLQTEQGQP